MNQRKALGWACAALWCGLATFLCGCVVEQDPAQASNPLTLIGALPPGCGSCCASWACGSNTATLGVHPINPVNRSSDYGDGEFRLDAGSFRFRDGTRGSVYVSNGELVAVHPVSGATTRCADLTGGSFVIWQKTKLYGELRWQVGIRHVGKVKLFVDGAARFVSAYDFDFTGSDGQAFFNQEPICRDVEPWGYPWQSDGLCSPNESCQDKEGCFLLGAESAGQYAVLIAKETYHRSMGTVDRTGIAGMPWLNIACSGTALSKMKLMDYDPEDGLTNPGQRQATLNMITARYCPGEVSFTTDGTPLVWRNAAGWFSRGVPRELEARWTKDGATCLNAPRSPDVTRDAVEIACGRTFPKCYEVAPRGEEWTSYVP